MNTIKRIASGGVLAATAMTGLGAMAASSADATVVGMTTTCNNVTVCRGGEITKTWDGSVNAWFDATTARTNQWRWIDVVGSNGHIYTSWKFASNSPTGVIVANNVPRGTRLHLVAHSYNPWTSNGSGAPKSGFWMRIARA